jgi:phosphoglycolate phosphatase
MSDLAVVILDLDGTLLDTSKRHYAVYRLIAKRLQVSALSLSNYWERRRVGSSNLNVLFQTGLPMSQRETAKDLWLQHIESVKMLASDQLLPGVRTWLETYQDRLEFLMVTLRSNPQGLENQLRQLALLDYFKDILVVPHQPQAHIAKAQAVTKNASSGKVLAWIGDSGVDMQAAQAIGARAIGVKSGIRTSDSLLAMGASEIFDSLPKVDLGKYLANLES